MMKISNVNTLKDFFEDCMMGRDATVMWVGSPVILLLASIRDI